MRRMLKLFNIDSILNDLDFLSSFFARSERGKRQLRAQSPTEYRFAFWSDVRRGVAATLSEVVTATKAMIERTISDSDRACREADTYSSAGRDDPPVTFLQRLRMLRTGALLFGRG